MFLGRLTLKHKNILTISGLFNLVELKNNSLVLLFKINQSEM